MRVFTGIRQLLTMNGPTTSPEARLGVMADAAVAVEGGVIRWVGAAADAPGSPDVVDLGGVVVMPGIVDPHTHLVYAGDRAADFDARCRGESYAAIAARGGGIKTTVKATRAAGEAELLGLAQVRLAALADNGVTTIEVKSGYGLSVADELKQLRVIAALARASRQTIIPTLLLHVIPTEHADDRPGWLALVERELLPAARGLAVAVDVYCDTGAFTRAESSRILSAARAAGFGLKAHAEQLTATGFGADAARLGAMSLEHLEHADDEVLDAMAEAGTVAVLLPCASAFLGDAARPPVAGLRARHIPMAIGTDHNPGSSPTYDPWLTATLACTLYGLTPGESLLGMTRHAALALRADDRGVIAPGLRADLAITRPEVGTWQHLVYGLGHRPIAATVIAGEWVSEGRA